MSQLILESLDEKRISVFEKLRVFKSIGVLGGGTSLSLQIGHRISYDFDFFTNDKLPRNLWKEITKTFGGRCRKLLDFEDQLNLVTPEGVKVTFFYDDYKPKYKVVKTDYVDLMDVKDIACNKAYIIGRRPKWRDYVDLYFILKGKHISVGDIIKHSVSKFGSDFSERLFLQQLLYWDDITDYKIEFINDEVLPDMIKSFLSNEVKAYQKDELRGMTLDAHRDSPK